MRNYKRVFAIIRQINQAGAEVTHGDLVETFTDGRTQSLKALTEGEFQEFERRLIASAPNNTKGSHSSDPLDKARKAIIAQFKSIGRTAKDAIAWAEKYGVKGQKKAFNDYNGQELYKLIMNAERVKTDFIISASKKL